MKTNSLLVVAACAMGLLPAGFAAVVQAKPGFGANCAGCHDSTRNGMGVVDYDTLTDLGKGDLKTFVVEAGQSVLLPVDVTDGHDRFAVALRDLERAGVLGGDAHRLAFTPDSNWVDHSTMSPPYYASTSSRHDWTGSTRQFVFDLQVDGSTPPDFYPLRFGVAGKGGGKWSHEEEFYLHVLPAGPVAGNGDMNGDGDVNMCDLALFAANWPNAGCSPENDYCGRSDLDLDGDVDFNDLYILASNWLVGQRRLDVSTVEDFETGDLSRFPWVNDVDAGWYVTSSQAHSETFCAQAAQIDHDQSATIQITLDCISGDIRFFVKISSESGFDWLKFYIDGAEQDKWSGEEDWTEVSFPVVEGMRTFGWVYAKDGSASAGGDTAWIDSIVFPINAPESEGLNSVVSDSP